MDFPIQLLRDGAWADTTRGATFDVVNPATGEVVAQVADAGAEDVAMMIDAAERAGRDWAATPAVERAAIMERAADLLEQRIDLLGVLLTREQGKPLAQSVGEIRYGVEYLRWFAEEARRIYGRTVPASSRSKRITVLRQPVGITACITPWNFPHLQIARKLGAALAAGCTMIVKPSELTPLSALELARSFVEAGLPDGVLQVAPACDPRPVSQALFGDPRVRLVSFTGSTDVGKILMREAATTVKRVSLELGGHAPFIVFADADLDLAVNEAVGAKVRNAGQTCISANRIYVHASVADEFTERLSTAFADLVVGDGLDAGVDMGPLIEPSALVKVERHVEDAVSRGARVVTGGNRLSVEGRSGAFFAPTVLATVDDTMLISREETFGPVAPVLTFDSDVEVVARANSSAYGLAAYFFTADLARATRVGELLEYGIVGVNDASIGAVQAPFGGVKASGFGREGGSEGLDDFLETKYVALGGL